MPHQPQQVPAITTRVNRPLWIRQQPQTAQKAELPRQEEWPESRTVRNSKLLSCINRLWGGL